MERTLARLTRAELTEEVRQVIGLPLKEADIVVCTMLDSIVRALRSGNKVEIRGFGTFNTRQRGGRTGRNPKTGARVDVPPKRIPFFKSEQGTPPTGCEGLIVPELARPGLAPVGTDATVDYEHD